MDRRNFLLGSLSLGGALTAGAVAVRPTDKGAPHTQYFNELNNELNKNGPMRPSMVIDLDLVDHNLEQVTSTVKRAGKHFRIVEKSLPSQKLIEYIAKYADTNRIMSFHQPFLNTDAIAFPEADILMGKPLPVRSAELFYKALEGQFNPARQLQWLIDTPQRMEQYLALAKQLGTKILVNIEIDVGLHRGGVNNNQVLKRILDLISENPQNLTFSGFMGYDAHVGMGVPSVLGSAQELMDKSMDIYQQFVNFTRSEFPMLWHEQLTLNTGGSPSYRLHEHETISTEVSTGTALLMPTHYDIPTLSSHVPAAFIATPVLKATGPIQLPALDAKSSVFSWWDVNQRETFYIYGGDWRADYESPKGLQMNEVLGQSPNQENVSSSSATQLGVDDQVFLRPHIVDSVLLEFGDLVVVRGGKIQDYWPIYQ